MYEKLDIYDENRIKTGKIIERKEGISLEKNELVLAVQCWIINSKGEFLFQKRSMLKIVMQVNGLLQVEEQIQEKQH